MKVFNEEKYFSRKNEMIEFVMNHISQYQGKVGYNILGTLATDYFLQNPTNNIPVSTSVGELLSKFNIYNEGCDPYIEMAKLLDQYSFLEGNCCEVAAGDYPRLAELTIPKIKLNHGNLTIYEPDVIPCNIKDVKIVRERLTKDTDITQFDTLYGMFPCSATLSIVEKAFEEDKNLMLAFCDCNHSTKEHPKWIGKYWAEDLCMDYREKYGNEVNIIQWPSSMGSDLPIMVRRSKKYK